MFLLRAHRPAVYRETQRLEHALGAVAPVPVIDDLDQVEMIVAALREAGALEAAVVPQVDAVHPAGADA